MVEGQSYICIDERKFKLQGNGNFPQPTQVVGLKFAVAVGFGSLDVHLMILQCVQKYQIGNTLKRTSP